MVNQHDGKQNKGDACTEIFHLLKNKDHRGLFLLLWKIQPACFVRSYCGTGFVSMVFAYFVELG